jgi:hypothetical protein
MGGLGNQMFQCAFGLSASLQLKTGYELDVGFLEDRAPKANFTYRSLELDVFQATSKITRLQLDRRFAKIFYRYFKRWPIVLETGLRFSAKYFKIHPDSIVVGYFQSEKYFCDIRPQILERFSFKNGFNDLTLGLAQKIRDDQSSVSIHVRRGDYVSNEAVLTVHGICGLDYYRDAVSYLESKVKTPRFYIFSDDMVWVKQHLKFNHPVEYIDHNLGKDSYQDMHLMSLCAHNVVANSSFSWWGAWLNLNPAKIVIAPKTWFAEPSIDSSDIVPSSWVRI